MCCFQASQWDENFLGVETTSYIAVSHGTSSWVEHTVKSSTSPGQVAQRVGVVVGSIPSQGTDKKQPMMQE